MHAMRPRCAEVATPRMGGVEPSILRPEDACYGRGHNEVLRLVEGGVQTARSRGQFQLQVIEDAWDNRRLQR